MEVSAAILRKSATWPEFFKLIKQACELNVARGAELLARMAVSAPMIVRDRQNASGALDLIAKCLKESNTEALHQSLRIVFIRNINLIKALNL